MAVRSYEELKAWQRATDLVQAVYESARAFPREEVYGLTSQLKRAAVSVPSNIAEGQGRKTTREFLHHLSIAHGSLMEVGTQVLIAARLKYLTAAEADGLLERAAECGRLVNGLSNALTNKLGSDIRSQP